MFIATANLLDPIPAALRDRMEILELAGYTDEDKLNIAKKYVVPTQLKAHGLSEEKYNWTDEGLTAMIRHYTREAGVRNLEREIGTACRKVATRMGEGDEVSPTVGPEEIRDYL